MGSRGQKSSGRGSNSGRGGGTSSGGAGASFSTAEAVDKLNQLMREGGSRKDMRSALEKIKEGQKITLYNPERNSNGGEMPGIVNNPIVWTKQGDGTWASNDGRRAENSDMMRRMDNGGVRLGAGEISTESRVEVTGRQGKEYNGLRYAKGQYDILKNGYKDGKPNSAGPEKVSQAGQITTYNGTQYGVTKEKGGYKVTHIPTGLSTNTGVGAEKLKTLNDVSNHIKKVDDIIKGMPSIRGQAERFNKTRRGD